MQIKLTSQFVTAIASALLFLPQAQATWYGFGVSDGADIILFEARWEYWPVGTYFAFWNSAPYPQGGYFYGGVATYGKGENATPEETAATLRHEVWSFWPSACYKGDRTRVVALGDPFTGGAMSGEGTEAGIHSGTLPFLETGKWYKMVMRSWVDPDQPKSRGYMGWWMQDVASNRWHMVGVISVPSEITGFKGCSCFVEKTGPAGRRVFDRRLAYQRLNNAWNKLDTITQKSIHPSTWHVIEDGTVFRYEDPMPKGHQHHAVADKDQLTFKLTNQADRPILGQMRLERPKAVALGNQLVVSWHISADGVPQLAYQMDVYSEKDGKGKQLKSVREAFPHITLKRLDLETRAVSVKLTVHDIFDQPTSIILPVETGEPQKSAGISATLAGLQYTYYEGKWQSLPSLAEETPKKHGRLNAIEDSPAQGRKNSYAFSFKGYLKAPETGIYTFNLRTCDGSRLTIDNRVIADNDGIHSTITHLSSALLEKGEHRFTLDYFRGTDSYALRDKLDIQWAGPGFDYRRIGPGDISSEPVISEPVAGLIPTISNGNRLSIRQVHQMNGHLFSSLELFSGKLMLGVVSSVSDIPNYILPAGKQSVWGRLWFDENVSVDSVEAEVFSSDTRSESWEYSTPGEQKLPLAVSSTKDSVAVTGEGTLFAFRKVSGDFTLTANIDKITRCSQTNGIAGNSLMGIMACKGTNSLWNQSASFGLWDTAANRIRGTACDRDLETSAQSRWPLDTSKPWIRISKKGQLWTGYTSVNGTKWEKVSERILRQDQPEFNVGVVFCTRPPGNNKTLFSGALSHIELTHDAFEIPRVHSTKVSVSQGQFVGVISSAQSPSTIYVRTSGAGVLKSTNAGVTLKRLKTTPSVRSISMSPSNSSVLLVGAGTNGSGTLWRSADAGETWNNVCGDIDFDGADDEVLNGETISFNPHNPQEVVAAGRTSGLFVSKDEGLTWSPAGLKDEHITIVAFSPYNKNLLVVGTSGGEDSFGKVYVSKNAGKTFNVVAKKRGWTVSNVAFEAIPEGGEYLYFATNTGVYYCYNLSQYLYQYRHTIRPDVHYIALTSWKLAKGRNQILVAPTDTDIIYSGQIGFFWHVEWKSWKSGAIRMNSLCCAGKEGETLYATAANGLFGSHDGGKSFKLVAGYH